MQWLIENHSDDIRTMVTSALDDGLEKEIQANSQDQGRHLSNSMQNSIIDFLSLLENVYQEASAERTVQKAMERNLMPAIEHIDTTMCDDATVRFSVEKATSKIERSPESNAQDVLFKELLRCWKPRKETTSN